MIAAHNDSIEIVHLLLKAKADVNISAEVSAFGCI